MLLPLCLSLHTSTKRRTPFFLSYISSSSRVKCQFTSNGCDQPSTSESDLLYNSVASWLLWEQLSSLKTCPVAVFYDFTDRCIFLHQQQGASDPEVAWLSIHFTDGHRQTENTNTSEPKWRQTLVLVSKICFNLWSYSFLLPQSHRYAASC